MNKVIGVDVDLTVVDPVPGWLDWYFRLTGKTLDVNVEFNIEKLMIHHHDPMQYWKNDKLYDNLEPIVGSVENLKNLKEAGFKIVFISNCYPEHLNSKKYFIKRNFPFADGFIDTADKGFVGVDYFIDDYNHYLNQVKTQNPDCICIKHISSINSKSEDYPYLDWKGIKDFILKG